MKPFSTHSYKTKKWPADDTPVVAADADAGGDVRLGDGTVDN